MIRAAAAIVAVVSLWCPTGSAAELSGEEIFNRDCVWCHGPSEEAPGTLQLRKTRGEDKALLTERDDLTPEFIEYVVRHGLRAMPVFYPSDLPAAQLDALSAYLTRRKGQP